MQGEEVRTEEVRTSGQLRPEVKGSEQRHGLQPVSYPRRPRPAQHVPPAKRVRKFHSVRGLPLKDDNFFMTRALLLLSHGQKHRLSLLLAENRPLKCKIPRKPKKST